MMMAHLTTPGGVSSPRVGVTCKSIKTMMTSKVSDTSSSIAPHRRLRALHASQGGFDNGGGGGSPNTKSKSKKKRKDSKTKDMKIKVVKEKKPVGELLSALWEEMKWEPLREDTAPDAVALMAVMEAAKARPTPGETWSSERWLEQEQAAEKIPDSVGKYWSGRWDKLAAGPPHLHSLPFSSSTSAELWLNSKIIFEL